MKTENTRLFHLDTLAAYEIRVPALLDEVWYDWGEGVTTTVEWVDSDSPVTLLAGTFDQAALRRLLRYLYARGLPLISVICIECDPGGGINACHSRIFWQIALSLQ